MAWAASFAAGGVPCSRLGLRTGRRVRASVPGGVAAAGFLLPLPTGGLATRVARTGTALPPAAPAATPPATPSPDTRAECRAAGFVLLVACIRSSAVYCNGLE